MILRAPRSAVKFCNEFLRKAKEFAPRSIVRFLPTLLTAVALTSAHSLAGIGAEVYSDRRDKSSLSRMLRSKEFRTRDLHWKTLKKVLASFAPRPGQKVDWHMALDSTANQRGAFTKILGAILHKMRPEKAAKLAPTSGKKGRRTKYHTFLVAILTTHEGVRIPLPRYTCDPKTFNRQGRPAKVRKTQIDLAKLMLEQLVELLPDGVRLIVTADSYYESEKLSNLARLLGFVFISPSDSNRCFADEDKPKKSNGERIRDYGLNLPMSSFSRLDLVRGQEDTASYRRYSERKTGPKDRRTYRLLHERRTVAGLGSVGIVYSWKTPVYEPRRNFQKKSFKVLICSDPDFPGEKVVEWYECRWTAIEIVFRELKQQLGFEDFTGQTLQALERYIDLVLLSFLYLEVERARLLAAPSTPEPVKRQAKTARTLGMQAVIRAEAAREALGEVKKALQSKRPSRLVMEFLDETTQSYRPEVLQPLYSPVVSATSQ